MSDGPTAILQRWSSNSSSSTATASGTSLYFRFKVGVTGLAFGLLANHLVDYGDLLWRDASWVLIIFLLLYTICLILAISYLSQSSSQPSNGNYSSFTPSHPPGLTRLRSYLTFFPITHVIHYHHGNGGSGIDSNKDGGRVGTLSSTEAMAASSSLSSDADDQGLAFRINAQLDVAIDAIVAEYVFPWYTKISDDRSFIEQCKAIIHAVFLQLGEKLRQVDRNEFAKEAIQIMHVHWREYAEALNKSQQGNRDDVTKNFKFVHTFLLDNKEVSGRYQKLVGRVLEELGIPDLNSPVMCQFLAGIIVKNFVLYYVELMCQPSWINGALMTLLSSGSMSVDITGSSSQNSSSPASPLPEPSPKMTVEMFPDEVIECASMCPSSSTAESTPTKKSRSSSGRSISGQSQDEMSAKGEQQEFKHFFDNISSSIDDASSASEPKTESSAGTTGTESARPSPTDKRFPLKSSGSSSSGMSMTNSPFPADPMLILTKRPRDLTPLKYPTSSLRTLSTALGSVMQATAFPLLPSECYNSEENNLALPKFCQPSISVLGKGLLKGQPVLEEISETDSHSPQPDDSLLQEDIQNESSDSDLKLSSNESGTQEGQTEMELMVNAMSSGEEEEPRDSPTSSKAVTTGPASHYYSFDEASKPKSASTSFFETSTLSLDGALDKSKRQASTDQLQLCSHEFKSDLDSDGKPNRSPVYEEPEDFAASIAKLRSLLEQKGRKSSTPPPLSAGAVEDGGDVFESPPSSSPSTATSSANNLDKPLVCIDNIPQISETCASESHTTPSSTSSMDNSKASSRFSFNEPIIPSETDSTTLDDAIDRTNYESVPEIKCCFRNVTIPKVENSADAGGQYMFYCIQYEGVYSDEKEDERGPQKLVYRTTTIKRKFKEFLTLQAHLEENVACKPHLKGIKTPTRWTNVSLTKSDAIVANQRRAMLEKYLQQLCYHPVIGFCHEVMVFMAYGEDGFCSFEVGDPKDLLTHRLDKLARKFTGVFNSLKDALPSFELDLSHAPTTPKSEGITPCDLKTESAFPSFPFQKYSSLPHEQEITLEPPWTDKFAEDWNSGPADSLKEHDEKSGEHSKDNATFHGPEIEVEEGKIFSVYPLAAAVTHLLCDVLWLPQYRPHPASVATFMSISGKSLENYVLETMDIFLSDEAILGYLEWLTISINNGQSDTDSRYDLNSEYGSEQDLKNIVKRRIPAWVRWMWGRNRLELTIDRITGLLQNPLVNHDLVLSLCELLFSKMVIVDENNSE